MASKRNWRKIGIRSAIILAALYLLICGGMYFLQEKFLFHPTVVDANTPWDLNIENSKGLEDEFAEMNFPSELGGKVNALHFKLDSTKGCVLYIHGNGGNAGICSRNRNLFLQAKWEVFVPDYRGYGKSTGEKSQAGLDADIEAAWNEIHKQFPADEIIIYGQSLGSGFATRLAAKHTPKMLILEAPYTSLADVGQSQYPWLPVRWLIQYPSPSLDYIGKVNCPVFVFHGDQDEVIPYAQGQKMAAAAQKGSLITLPGNGHKNVQGRPEFQAKLAQILR
jgi:uncharacterized protein